MAESTFFYDLDLNLFDDFADVIESFDLAGKVKMCGPAIKRHSSSMASITAMLPISGT